MKNIAVFVSGGGTNLQALIDAAQCGRLTSGRISLVLASKYDTQAQKRAEVNGIPAAVVCRKEYETREGFTDAVLDVIGGYSIDLVVLAGFNCLLSERFTEEYSGRIINVHPTLIPAFCGDGWFGMRVHEGVIAAGVKLSGATVHFVTEVTDGGPIVLQKAVVVREDDTPESLQQRVMIEAEWDILPRAAELICAGRVSIRGNKTFIV